MGVAVEGAIPLVLVFFVALVILTLLRSLNIKQYLSVQSSNQVEERPMTKKKTLAIISTIETIWAIGVSYTTSVLSP